MPNKAAMRNDHSTTKLSIVFDASAHYATEPFSNDIPEAGSCLLPYLLDILVRFCSEKITIVADIN